jgi:hypothetical protein
MKPTKSTAEALIIGSLTFSESVAPAVRGDPAVTYRPAGKNGGALSFNAAIMDAFPELAACSRVRVFVAEGKPAVALFPCGEAEGTTFMRDGSKSARVRKKIQGRVLSKLTAYSRIEYKVEAIQSPRKGWLLTPTTSERKA